MTWPFENDTSTITKKLAKNSLKAGKMRNILIVMTILLSVALMSGLALYIASMQTANSRQLENLQQVFLHLLTRAHKTQLKSAEWKTLRFSIQSAHTRLWPLFVL